MRPSLLALALFMQAALPAAVCLADQTADSIDYFAAIAREPEPVAGETYYLRHNIMHEKGEHVATNYWKGSLTPINTQVTLVAVKKKLLKLKVVSTGEEITVTNVPDYSKKDIPTIARNLLTRTPVPIEQFGEQMAANIRGGILVRGMTREQVVMTRGYPPGHRTPSLENDTWTYWYNRMANYAYVFVDGRLDSGRGIE